MTKKRSWSLAAALAIGVLIGFGGQQVFATPEADPPVFEQVEVPKVDDLAAHFSVLTNFDDTRPEELPRELARAWRDEVSRDSADVAVGSVVTDSGHDITIAVDDAALCFSDQYADLGASTTCATPEDALSGNVIPVSVCEAGGVPGKVRLLGVMPDDVKVVQLVSKNGETRIDVASNVFEIHVEPVDSEVYAIDPETGDRRLLTRLPLAGFALGPNEICDPPS